MSEINYGDVLGTLACGGGGMAPSQTPPSTYEIPWRSWVHERLQAAGITGDYTVIIPVVATPPPNGTVWMPGHQEAFYSIGLVPVMGAAVTLDGVTGAQDNHGIVIFRLSHIHYAHLHIEAPGYYPYDNTRFYAGGSDMHFIPLVPIGGNTPPISGEGQEPWTQPPAGGGGGGNGSSNGGQGARTSLLSSSLGKILVFGGGAVAIYLLMKKR